MATAGGRRRDAGRAPRQRLAAAPGV